MIRAAGSGELWQGCHSVRAVGPVIVLIAASFRNDRNSALRIPCHRFNLRAMVFFGPVSRPEPPRSIGRPVGGSVQHRGNTSLRCFLDESSEGTAVEQVIHDVVEIHCDATTAFAGSGPKRCSALTSRQCQLISSPASWWRSLYFGTCMACSFVRSGRISSLYRRSVRIARRQYAGETLAILWTIASHGMKN